jgi:hypothetical protein
LAKIKIKNETATVFNKNNVMVDFSDTILFGTQRQEIQSLK